MGTETWTYDSPGVVKMTGDYTSTYLVYMKVKIVQASTTKYFVITNSQLVAGETKLTLDGQGSYTLTNDTITAHVASSWFSPGGGFPLYAPIDHGSQYGLSDDDHTIYIKHSLSTVQHDFLVGKGDNTFEKKTLAETQEILGVGEGGVAFWTDMPTPTRVSDTQFTIVDTSNTNKYNKKFTKRTILKWLEGSTVNIAMVVSASYDSNTVTINIVGDSLTAGFTDMKYCLHQAQKLEWIWPGYLSVATGVGRSHYADCDLVKFSVDFRIETAGTTSGNDTIDINDDGTTIITTKPSIAYTGTSDLDNVCDNPTTVIAKDSKLTLDIDAVCNTPGQSAYVVLFVCPEAWVYLE